MTLPAADSHQLCLRGPADGTSFEPDGSPPPSQFVAAVHHGSLCCGDEYDEAEDHSDGGCDCLPPTRGLYALDLDASIANGTHWVYTYQWEVLASC